MVIIVASLKLPDTPFSATIGAAARRFGGTLPANREKSQAKLGRMPSVCGRLAKPALAANRRLR
jgi:hypothetical protein